MIFIDLQQAFPSLNHDILLNKLKTIGFENNDLTLMQKYLKNTNHKTIIKNINLKIKYSIMVFGKALALLALYSIYT